MMNTRKILKETINQFILDEQIDFENTSGEFYAVDIHEPNEAEDVCDREYFDDEDEAYKYAKDSVRNENLVAEIYYYYDEWGEINSMADLKDWSIDWDWVDAIGTLDGVQNTQVTMDSGPVHMDNGSNLYINILNETLNEITDNGLLPNLFRKWAKEVNIELLPDLMAKCERWDGNDTKNIQETIMNTADEAFHKFFLYNDLSNDNVSIDVDEMDETAFHMIEGSDKDTNVGKYYNKVMLCLRELAFYFHGQ